MDNKNFVIKRSFNSDDGTLYSPGFCYRIGGTIYTVKKVINTEPNSPMREVSGSDGNTTVMLLSTLDKDIKEITRSGGIAGEILPVDERYIKKDVK